MDIVYSFIQFILHIDQHLASLIAQYGLWVFGILFIIIFCETGLIITPFLPGDSLLFAAGALTAVGNLNTHWMAALLIIAAIAGDSLNYYLGSHFGTKPFQSERGLLFNKKYLERAHAFYQKYGGKTIIIARFIPIIRTFAPFVAGMGSMSYTRFISFNIVGAILWVILMVYAGYFFGNIPFVANHFSGVILFIIFISLLPPLVEYIRHKRTKLKCAGY